MYTTRSFASYLQVRTCMDGRHRAAPASDACGLTSRWVEAFDFLATISTASQLCTATSGIMVKVNWDKPNVWATTDFECYVNPVDLEELLESKWPSKMVRGVKQQFYHVEVGPVTHAGIGRLH